MPSFDISSEINWQELDNATQQALKEVSSRFDFKGIESKIDLDKKNKKVTLWISERDKMESLKDVLQNKLVKRGVSLLAFEFQKLEEASGSAGRQEAVIQAGISKEKAKKIISKIKEQNYRVQTQIQDEQVRVNGKSRDILQDVIGFLKEKQDDLQVPMQFGNFRD